VTGQLAEVNVPALAVKLQVDAPMFEALLVEPAGQASLAQQCDAAVLEHARSLAGLTVLPAADLDQYRVDAAQREQMRKQQPSRPGADDANLSASAHDPLR
jgi:hypothetical protein